jgi:MFS transporter, SP family, sugar:H+ symporter
LVTILEYAVHFLNIQLPVSDDEEQVINGIKDMKAWLREFGAPNSDLTLHPYGYAITSSQESLVVSILSAGTFVGQSFIHP